ncbi:MAG: deaminase domain-containing protein [Tumebacillaceae bacterium]
MYQYFHLESEQGLRYADMVMGDIELLKSYIKTLQPLQEEEASTYKQLFRTGNFGIAYLNVPNNSKKYIAFSAIQDQDEIPAWQDLPHFTLTYLEEYEKMKYPALAVSPENTVVDLDLAYLRNVDTESKLIEQIERDLAILITKNQDITGRLVLYTLREPCMSCQYVLSMFAETYEYDLDITVLFSKYLPAHKGVTAYGPTLGK